MIPGLTPPSAFPNCVGRLSCGLGLGRICDRAASPKSKAPFVGQPSRQRPDVPERRTSERRTGSQRPHPTLRPSDHPGPSLPLITVFLPLAVIAHFSRLPWGASGQGQGRFRTRTQRRAFPRAFITSQFSAVRALLAAGTLLLRRIVN